MYTDAIPVLLEKRLLMIDKPDDWSASLKLDQIHPFSVAIVIVYVAME
jgi:hypothetical protein